MLVFGMKFILGSALNVNPARQYRVWALASRTGIDVSARASAAKANHRVARFMTYPPRTADGRRPNVVGTAVQGRLYKAPSWKAPGGARFAPPRRHHCGLVHAACRSITQNRVRTATLSSRSS